MEGKESDENEGESPWVQADSHRIPSVWTWPCAAVLQDCQEKWVVYDLFTFRGEAHLTPAHEKVSARDKTPPTAHSLPRLPSDRAVLPSLVLSLRLGPLPQSGPPRRKLRP